MDLDRLRIELRCAICLDIITDPRLLECMHSFCQYCLQTTYSQENNGIECPTCKSFIKISQEELQKLPSDPVKYLKLLRFQNLRESAPESFESFELTHFCSVHTTTPVTNYCGHCNSLICNDCLASHPPDFISSINEQSLINRESINEKLHSVQNIKQQINQNIEKLINQVQQFIEQKQSIEIEQIDKYFDELQNDVLLHLNDRRNKVKLTLNDHYKEKIKTIDIKLDESEIKLLSIDNLTKYTTQIIESRDDTSLVAVHSLLEKQFEALRQTPLENIVSDNEPEAEFEFKPSNSQKILDQIQQFGTVIDLRLKRPSALHSIITTATRNIIAPLKRPIQFNLQLNNRQNEPLTDDLGIEPKVSIRPVAPHSIQINRLDNGQFSICLTIDKEGVYQVSIQLFETHVIGSPFEMNCKQIVSLFDPSNRLGSKPNYAALNRDCFQTIGGMTDTRFGSPMYTAYNKDGDYFVTDWTHLKIHRVEGNPKGRITDFVSKATGFQQQIRPTGIAINNENGDVIVTDNLPKPRLLVFDSEGRFKTEIIVPRFKLPWGIAFNQKQQFIVSDFNSNEIFIFNSNLEMVKCFGITGSAPGQLNRPVGIAVDSNDNILIGERENARISIFTDSGIFKSSFGKPGSGNGLFRPKHNLNLAVDSWDNIIVADAGHNILQFFNAGGEFISRYGTTGTSVGDFSNPNGVLVNPVNGNIVVVEQFNKRLQFINVPK